MSTLYGVKNKVKGKWKQVEGNVNQQAGHISNKPSKGLKGGMQKITGKVQETLGDAEVRTSANTTTKRNRKTV